jgi:hypothetical protein
MPLDRATFCRFTVARSCIAGFDKLTNRHAARHILHNLGNRVGRCGSPNMMFEYLPSVRTASVSNSHEGFFAASTAVTAFTVTVMTGMAAI